MTKIDVLSILNLSNMTRGTFQNIIPLGYKNFDFSEAADKAKNEPYQSQV